MTQNNNFVIPEFVVIKNSQFNQLHKRLDDTKDSVNAIKRQFILNMQHDIRTPFNGIWSMAAMLSEQESEPVKKKLLSLIASSAKELLGYCNDILHFTESELDDSLIMEEFCLKKLIDKINVIQQPAIERKNINFKTDCHKDIPPVIIGNKHKLLQILLNLVGNSIKFTDEGHVSLNVKLYDLQKDKAAIMFIVEDTGIGMSETELNQLYQQFGRFNPSNQGKYKGLGLGLNITARLVKQMNGRIEVHSKPDNGCTFIYLQHFDLPLKKVVKSKLAKNYKVK